MDKFDKKPDFPHVDHHDANRDGVRDDSVHPRVDYKNDPIPNPNPNASHQRGPVVRELDKDDKDRVVFTEADKKNADLPVAKPSDPDPVILSGATRVGAPEVLDVPGVKVVKPFEVSKHPLTEDEKAIQYAHDAKKEPPSVPGQVKVHAIRNGTYKGTALKANDVFFVEHKDFNGSWMEKV